MVGKDKQQEHRPGLARRTWNSLPKQGGLILIVALLISALLHIFSGQRLSGYRPAPRISSNLPKDAIKVRIVDKQPKASKAPKPEAPASEKLPKILETPQVKTEKPVDASYVGAVDHSTTKETRVSDKLKRDKAKDPGQKGSPDARPGIKQDQNVTDMPMKNRPPSLQDQTPPPTSPQKQGPALMSEQGRVSFQTSDRKPRNNYEALLPTGVADLPGQVNAGYQDYVDDHIQEGDRIDINTTEYRFIGYFTNMRKAIELVWNYPVEASRKGMQGEVGLEFAINRDGKASNVRVIKSSGYELLDRAIIDAIQLASPFAPLPEGFGKQRILVTGSFRYVLSAYGTH